MNNIPNRFHARLMDCYADHQAQFNEMMLQMEMEFRVHSLPVRSLARSSR